MKLILTDKEKRAATYLELDDESVGKVVKSLAHTILIASTEQGKFTAVSAAIVLCSMAAEANADSFKLDINGIKNKTNDYGNWILTVKRRR